VRYGNGVQLLRPFTALLIVNEGKPGPAGRRRLSLTSSLAEGREIAARVIALSTTACLIEDCETPSETSETWLKLPTKGPVQVMIEPGPKQKLLCTFCKPLYPAEVEALMQVTPAPNPHGQRHPRPRCSFL
jgi:hypothetical protein